VDEKSTEVKSKKRVGKWLIIAVIVLVVISAGVLLVLLAAENYSGRSQFCGTQCHIMKPNYETWKKDKHSQPDKETGKITGCIDCHYKPGEKPTPKAKFRGLGQLFSYLATGDKEVRKRPVVSDLGCTTSKCHPMDKLLVKKIDYKKKYETKYKGNLIPFEHKTHLEKVIDGQKLQCTSCHLHQSRDKHFEVPKELCFICHFRKAKENEGRAKCAVCHEIPTKPMQVKKAPGEAGTDDKPKKPITHKELEAAKISCNRCHLEMIMGSTALKMDLCLECHHDASPELLAKVSNKKLMHMEHVTKQTARCNQCHETIDHKKSSYLDAAVQNCAACHPEPHFYTKKILAGVGGVGEGSKEKFPSLMHSFGTNCTGCHQQDGRDGKGNKVRKGSNKTCGECHHKDPKYEKMTIQWAKDIVDAVAETKLAEKAALEAMEQAKGAAPAAILTKATAKVKLGQENLRVVTAGGGVHNKKYAMLLLDMATQNFQEVVAELKPKGGTDEK
jgi:ABC-type cobalt transport system substrate-binding protein